jgi:Flp pilus assembly protein TadD
MCYPLRDRSWATQFVSLLVIGGGVCAPDALTFAARVRPHAAKVEDTAARQQESGSGANARFNSGAELAVMVHDASGAPIAATAMVHVYRQGATPSGQAATSDGRAMFVLMPLGDFTVVVEAPGYQTARKDVSLPTAQRAQIDIFLRRDLSAASMAGVASAVPGRAVLAPKAKEAFEKGLQAMGAEKLGNAEKYVGEAMRLAPGHPDVLYARGVLYLKQGKFAAAQESLGKATQLDPEHARAFAALGMAESDQGKYEAAIVPLEKALQLDAAVGWEAQWSLAKAFYQVGRYEEALKMSQAAREASKEKAPQIALLVAQSLTAVGRYEQAAAELRGFAKDHGDRAEATTARRWLQKLEASGKIEASKQEARKQ